MLMDMSFMSKFLVQGNDAGKCLNKLSTANVDDKVETITYTQWYSHSLTHLLNYSLTRYYIK